MHCSRSESVKSSATAAAVSAAAATATAVTATAAAVAHVCGRPDCHDACKREWVLTHSESFAGACAFAEASAGAFAGAFAGAWVELETPEQFTGIHCSGQVKLF